MVLDKRERKYKEWLKYEKQTGYGRRYNSKNRPVEFVPLDEKEFMGWYLSFVLKDQTKEKNKDLILDIVNFNRSHLCKSPKIIKKIRSLNFEAEPTLNFLKSISYRNRPVYMYDMDSFYGYLYQGLFTSKIHNHQYNHLKEKYGDNFNPKLFYRVTEHRYNIPVVNYYVNYGYGFNDRHINLQNLKVKIEQCWVSEIGLLDREWEKKNDFIWNEYYKGFDLGIPQKGRQGRYRDYYWKEQLPRKVRRHSNIYLSNLKQLNYIDDQELENEFSKNKIRRMPINIK